MTEKSDKEERDQGMEDETFYPNLRNLYDQRGWRTGPKTKEGKERKREREEIEKKERQVRIEKNWEKERDQAQMVKHPTPSPAVDVLIEEKEQNECVEGKMKEDKAGGFRVKMKGVLAYCHYKNLYIDSRR